ncbi:ATP-binding protein [Vibrio tubiashii]|uniref:HAMP domain-containing sensor histidine kinase n=1 Tax=Vibrio tubiashii TaxID=29498 RepID=UPI00234F4630|nr:ATP-binding protein [Vibrio tubiashii]WCP67821.1 ATP-binding protein [Vibrio tubiashii]
MSLRVKTILGIALIEAVLLAILLTLTLNYLRTTNFDGLDQRAVSTSDLFASTVKNAVLSYDLATVESFTQELLHNKDIVYVAVFGEEGQLLSSLGNLPGDYSPSRLEQGSSRVKDGTFDVSSPIEESGIKFGEVWLGFDMSALNKAIDSAKKWSTLIVLGEMALVALFSYVLGAYLTRRLSELKRAADDIAAGSRQVDIHTDSKDELATVSRAFINMVAQIKESEHNAERYRNELEHSNASLETRVQKRTQALTDANRQLTDTNERLKSTQERLVESEKLASIGTMAAGVAHEINNPMGAVSSNLQMCQSYLSTYLAWIERSEALYDSSNDKALQQLQQWKQTHYVDCIEEDFRDSLNEAMVSVDRVRSIVTALQRYATQLNQDKGEREPLLLKQLLKHCLESLAPSEHLTVSLSPSLNNLPTLHVHVDDFRQLFTELLKNAIQSCERMAKPSEGQISISAQMHEHHLIILIADNGVGVDDAHLKRLYDPFFTTLPVGQGMGLGLTFSYSIIRSHEGAIRIQNRNTGGVNVTLAFPLSLTNHVTIATANSA